MSKMLETDRFDQVALDTRCLASIGALERFDHSAYRRQLLELVGVLVAVLDARIAVFLLAAGREASVLEDSVRCQSLFSILHLPWSFDQWCSIRLGFSFFGCLVCCLVGHHFVVIIVVVVVLCVRVVIHQIQVIIVQICRLVLGLGYTLLLASLLSVSIRYVGITLVFGLQFRLFLE